MYQNQYGGAQYPQGGYPQGGYPQGGYPQGPGYPAQPGYPPQPGFVSDPYPQQPGGYGQPGMVGDDADVKGFDFSDKSIRRGFIRKVYSILMCQLLVTMGFIALFIFHMPTQNWVFRNPAVFYVALAIMLVTLVSMACCESVRRNSPMNVIFLSLFTLAESFLLGVSCSTYKANEVMLAVGITAAVCLALTLFAFQTKWDFTMMGGFLLCATVVLMIFGIVLIFWRDNTARIAYASFGALLFSFYLVYDTQLMLGGSHKYSISPEEYIFAALNLYLDIVNIFMYILTIIGATRD